MDQKRIGAFIAQCRREKNLTQIQLAEQLGHLSMIFDAKWQNFCVRKIPMPMLV